MSVDYIAVATSVGIILGAIGGIPQILRWFGTHPHLRIRNVRVYYNPDTKAHGFYTYLENGKAHAVPASNYVSFHIENALPPLARRLGRHFAGRLLVKRTHATGLIIAASMSNPETGAQFYNFSRNEGNNILAPGELTWIREEIKPFVSSPEFRVYVSAVSKEGDSARTDLIVKVTRVETLEPMPYKGQ